MLETLSVCTQEKHESHSEIDGTTPDLHYHCQKRELVSVLKTLMKEMLQFSDREVRLQGIILCEGENVPPIIHFLSSYTGV